MFACVLIGFCPSPSQAGPSVVKILKLTEQVDDAGTHPLLLHVMVITDLDGKCTRGVGQDHVHCHFV